MDILTIVAILVIIVGGIGSYLEHQQRKWEKEQFAYHFFKPPIERKYSTEAQRAKVKGVLTQIYLELRKPGVDPQSDVFQGLEMLLDYLERIAKKEGYHEEVAEVAKQFGPKVA